MICTNSVGAINHPHPLGNGSNTKFPDASPGPSLQAGSWKGSRLWPAMFTLFCITHDSVLGNVTSQEVCWKLSFWENNRSAWGKSPFFYPIYFLLIGVLSKDVISGAEASILQQWGDKHENEHTTHWIWPKRRGNISGFSRAWATKLTATYLHIWGKQAQRGWNHCWEPATTPLLVAKFTPTWYNNQAKTSTTLVFMKPV